MPTRTWLSAAYVARPITAAGMPPSSSRVTPTPAATASPYWAALKATFSPGTRRAWARLTPATIPSGIQAPGARRNPTASTASVSENDQPCRPITIRTEVASASAIATASTGRDHQGGERQPTSRASSTAATAIIAVAKEIRRSTGVERRPSRITSRCCRRSWPSLTHRSPGRWLRPPNRRRTNDAIDSSLSTVRAGRKASAAIRSLPVSENAPPPVDPDGSCK